LQLKRAIGSYISQTYRPLELLVLVRDDDPESKAVVLSYGRDDIRLIEFAGQPERSLGELRNLVISHSRGEYFCQWDDDDWYHNERVEIQMSCLQPHAKSGSVLAKNILYHMPNREAYVSPIGPWANSILCRKDIITGEIRYPHVSLQEDSIFLNRLFGINCLIPVLAPWTYIYVYHGKNSWHSRHFRRLFGHSKKLPPAISALVTDVLEGKLDNAEASRLLMREEVLKEMDYFYFPPLAKRQIFANICQGSAYLLQRIVASVINFARRAS